jgi:hypothetical protein
LHKTPTQTKSGLTESLCPSFFDPFFHLLHSTASLSIHMNHVQMPVKRTASRRASRDDLPSDDSSSQGDNFVIAPHPRRTTRKTTQQGDVSSSHGDEEATNMAEG